MASTYKAANGKQFTIGSDGRITIGGQAAQAPTTPAAAQSAATTPANQSYVQYVQSNYQPAAKTPAITQQDASNAKIQQRHRRFETAASVLMLIDAPLSFY